jgi:hypothetical protein
MQELFLNVSREKKNGRIINGLSRYSGNIIKYEFIWKKVFKTGAES